VRATITAAKTPVEWIVVDASSINVVDITALQKIDELREELAAQGIVLATARAKRNLRKFFNHDWGMNRHELHARYRFDTIKSAVRAFNNRVEEGVFPGPDS
jgi:MFS superfamily sulfate permease-like transporter